MNDDVKAAADAALVESMVRQLRDCVSVSDWIAGEPARTASAVAAAREETVAACAMEFERALAEGEAFTLTGLATPLADRIAELEAVHAEQMGTQRDHLRRSEERCDDLKAERDALTNLIKDGMRVANQLTQETQTPEEMATDLVRQVREARLQRDALRAQVDAVRALCARFERGGGTLWPGEVLAAMDGAKP